MAELNESENSKANPFSFSNFVLKQDEQQQGQDQASSSAASETTTDDEINPFLFEKLSKKNKPAEANNKNTKKKPIKTRKLQIVEDVDSMTDIFADVPATNASPKQTKKAELDILDNDSDGSLNSTDELSASPQSETYILPDETKIPNSDLVEQLQQLKLQNAELQREVEKIRKEYKEYTEASNKKISTLKKELDTTRKKEAEDTKVLEDVVKMVEDNLQTTTKRAVKAEATVKKLVEEIRILKEENVSMTEFQSLQMQHFHQLNTIKEKSLNAARLMRTAANKTEPQIRELQNGISSLRFLADTFEDIGMVSDLPKKEDGKR